MQRCKKHPDKLLKRKCFLCKKKICHKCAYKKFHHYFCSKKCAYKYVYSRFKKTELYKNPLHFWYIRFVFGGFIVLFLFSFYALINRPYFKEIKILERKKILKQNRIIFFKGSIKRFPIKEKEIYLTFDGGSYAERVDIILDVLKKENIKATFFLTGEFIKKFPEKVKKIVKDSHEVGNHTYTHPHLTSFALNGFQYTLKNIKPERIFKELYKTEEIFRKTTGKQMKLFWRAPYGEENRYIREWAGRFLYIHIRWTFDFLDWKSIKDYQKRLKDFLKIKDKRGYILLLHLGSPEREKEEYRLFLEELIKNLKKEGYKFKKISEGLKKLGVYYET